MSDQSAKQHIKEFFNLYPKYSYGVTELRTIFGVTKKEKSSFKQILQDLVESEFILCDEDRQYRRNSAHSANSANSAHSAHSANSANSVHPSEKPVKKSFSWNDPMKSKSKSSPKSHPKNNAEVSEQAKLKREARHQGYIPPGFEDHHRGRVYQEGKLWRVQQAGMHQPSFMLPQDIAPYGDGDKVMFKIKGEDHAEIVAGIDSDLSFEDVKVAFLKDNDLRPSFPQLVKEQVSAIDIPRFDDHAKRKDYRSLKTICIDPLGARDHDDAISLEKKGSGWILGVHIADVSHYVTEDSPLDKEALKRSFTQYLPWQAVHMLPEKLSSDLCSLKVGQDRLAFSCMVELSGSGIVKDFEFTKSYIQVDEFHTYEEAMALAEEKPRSDLSRLRRVTRLLNERRKKAGLLLLDMPETRVGFDDFGEPVGLEQKSHIESMNWIEECMLLANQCCAQFLKSNAIPGVFREHGYPKEDEVRELATADAELFQGTGALDQYFKDGNAPESNVHKGLFELFKKLVENASGDLSKTRKVLRAMQKADYKPDGAGHFALRWDDYAHFTSPIRRYADLVVHRQMSAKLTRHKLPHDEDQVSEICGHISSRELDIMKTERRGVKFCGAWIAQDYLEEELDGIVSGMQNFGLFVEIPGLGFEGLARFKTIPGDFYEYNEDKHIVYGRRSGRVIQNGDTIRIKVIKVNVLRGEIDFAGVTGGASNDSESQRNSSPEGRRENFRRKHSEKTPARKKGERSHHRRGEKPAKKTTQEKLFDEDGSGQGSKISISLRGLEPGEFSEDGSGGEAISPWDMIQRTQNKSSIQDDQIIQVQDPNRKEKEAWSNVRGMSEPRQVKKKGFRKLKDNPDKYEASWDEPNKKSKKSSKSKKSTKSANATLKSLENELDIFDEILTDDRSWQGKSVKRKSSGTSRSSKAKSAQSRNGSQKAGDAQSTWRKKSETPRSKKSSSKESKNVTRQKKPHKGSSHESE